ncbi:MAG: Crossover junction endodeoxyribonuclease RuvC [Parcubacteria group bacterium GW2011_GWF2_38_76]|nr:MAG: Crossover junction endodeoxyribonuclease RuvC [Parcubacteria group bacterium GW2011_GWF2_38_76]
MKVIGVDPGYDKFGVAILEKRGGFDELIFSDCLRSSAKLPLSERMFIIGSEFDRIIKKYKPDTLAIEKLFFTTNQKTAMGVSEIKGVATYIAKNNGLNTHEYTPLQVKMAIVGYGKADKNQVSKMVPLLIKNFSKGEKKKMEDDEFDACAVAITCLAIERQTVGK